MLKLKTVSLILLLCCLSQALRSKSLQAHAGEVSQDFCLKDSYEREAGTAVPPGCPPAFDKLGEMCYQVCPSGLVRSGVDCSQTCPKDWIDEGLSCRFREYGRGGGYPWKFGDALNDSGMFRRCQRDNGRGNCEKWGAVVYPKCKDGYSNFGCCICRPRTPNCDALGMGPRKDLSCAKKNKIGSPLSICGSEKEKSADLCFNKCKSGYSYTGGEGSVCWSDVPAGWVNCGTGAAKDSSTCESIVSSDVSSYSKCADLSF